MSNQPEVVIGLHFYQPPREAVHKRLEHVNSDPQGINWTEIITQECYRPLRDLSVLPKVSYDFYGTLDRALASIDLDTKDAMRAHLYDNGVADTYIHPLLPDLSKDDKRIVVGAGVKRFVDITGRSPRFFWLPETAIDTETLQVLAEYGIEGFFCSPDQVELNNGSDASNTPTRIRLPSGSSILAMPFDRHFSKKLAFDDNPDDKDRADAYRFTSRVVLPALGRLRNGFPLVGYTDGETFGHHMQWGGAFIDTLVNHALPASGVKVVPINEVDMDSVTLAEGSIRERSAWGCSHGDLARWHGGCDCGGWNVGWKRPFYHGVHGLNRSVTQLVEAELGDGYLEKITAYFEQGFGNPGAGSSAPELSLVSAKVSALTAVTSCATFFEDPGVSGGINILFARQTVEHLVDAGLVKDAGRIWSRFLNIMTNVYNPANNKNGFEMARDLLGDAV